MSIEERPLSMGKKNRRNSPGPEGPFERLAETNGCECNGKSNGRSDLAGATTIWLAWEGCFLRCPPPGKRNCCRGGTKRILMKLHQAISATSDEIFREPFVRDKTAHRSILVDDEPCSNGTLSR